MTKYTKELIRESFLQLLDEKPLNKITVRDIAEKCGINRNSFYYHYPDIPALIQEITRNEADSIIAQYPSVDSTETAMLAVIDFTEANRRSVMHVYQSVNRDIFEQYLWSVCDYISAAYSATLFQGKSIAASDQELICEYLSTQCFGLAMNWISRGMKEDVRSKVSRYCELRKGSIERMIEIAEQA